MQTYKYVYIQERAKNIIQVHSFLIIKNVLLVGSCLRVLTKKVTHTMALNMYTSFFLNNLFVSG